MTPEIEHKHLPEGEHYLTVNGQQGPLAKIDAPAYHPAGYIAFAAQYVYDYPVVMKAEVADVKEIHL